MKTRGRVLALLPAVLLAAVCGKKADTARILPMLGITPSNESIDYVENKTQFQLHALLTEQRHPATWTLSQTIKSDTLAGLRMLSQADEDIRIKFAALSGDTALLEQAADAVASAIIRKRRIYIYGCGATGRLAKQMESDFWRPFWRRIAADKAIREKLAGVVSTTIGNDLIGEMTGGDRALISSLEGFEDLQLIGKLQYEDHGLTKEDVVICVTEGGETSSVIGTIRRGLDSWTMAPGYTPEESRKSLYFVYNNPDVLLRPFDRSRVVLDEPGITRINLTTGPQSITGSTRMQATTSETYVVGTILEAGIERVLRRHLDAGEMAGLGFPDKFSIAGQLEGFGKVLDATRRALPAMAGLTGLEAATYAAGRFSTYFAVGGLVTVFIDGTERSPTFRLFPLDTVNEPRRKCWIQVRTAARDGKEAWLSFLGRPFRGLESSFYEGKFEALIDDPYLRRAALDSLTRAGDDQQELYDLSSPEPDTTGRAPAAGDLGVVVMFGPEERSIDDPGSYFRKFMDGTSTAGASLAVMFISDSPESAERAGAAMRRIFAGKKNGVVFIPVIVDADGDPLEMKARIAAKMLLNAHSTAVFAKLGRVVGNTMTNVSPSNLKLVGRATYLIQSHVNDVIGRKAWAKEYGQREPITYAEANAVLYDSINWLKKDREQAGQTAEVAFSIIRIIESLRDGRPIPSEKALALAVAPGGLAAYLDSLPTD